MWMHRHRGNRLLLLGCCAALYFCTASAQDIVTRDRNLEWQINDARCRGLGRLSVAIADGPAALFYSPGRLAFTPHPTFEMGVNSYTGSNGDDIYKETPAYSGEGSYQWYPKFSHAAFTAQVVEFGDDFALVSGIGYNSFVAAGSKLELSREYWWTGLENRYYEIRTTEGGLNTVSVGVAISKLRRTAIGFVVSTSVSSKCTFERDITYSPAVRYANFLDRTEGKASGTFVSIGAATALSKRVGVAVLIRPAFDYTTRDRVAEIYLDDTRRDYVNLPDAKQKMPTVITIGATYLIHPSLLLAAELQRQSFSRVADANLNDGYSIRVGAEIKTAFPIRLGLFRDAIVIRDADEYINSGLYGFTSGIRVGGENYHADLFGEYSFWRHDYLFGFWSIRELAEGHDNNFRYDEHLLTLGLTVSYHLE
jgi:hypothetical protein